MHRIDIRTGDYEEKLDSDWLVALTYACSVPNLADLLRYKVLVRAKRVHLICLTVNSKYSQNWVL